DGAMNGPAFVGYIEKCLGPTLRRGDTVVMDNCRVHKVAGVKEAIERRGATVAYLPAYSPDLNPIELSFSVKSPVPMRGCVNARGPRPMLHPSAWRILTNGGSRMSRKTIVILCKPPSYRLTFLVEHVPRGDQHLLGK